MHKQIPIKYSHRKTVGLYISAKGIEVRAPYHTPSRFINEFIDSKQSWIREKRLEIERKESDKFQLVNNGFITIEGAPKRIVIKSSVKNTCYVNDSEIIFELKDNNKNTAERIFAKYLTNLAKATITPLALGTAKQAGLESKLSAIKFRRTKSKWGHCTVSGTLQFNWLIMMAPVSVIHYLVCHEVSHLKHMNHSKDFWGFVEQLCPNYRDEKKWLKENGYKLSIL